jgi:hypothetical protein
VNEAVNVVSEAHEGAEAGELGDLAGDEVADFVEFTPYEFKKITP